MRSFLTLISTPGRLGLIAVGLLGILLLTGCLSTARLEQVEQIAIQAAERLEHGQAAVEQARATLAKAEALAERIDSQEARDAVQTAQRAVDEAELALPALQLAATDTAQAFTAARQAREAGASWWQVLLAAGVTLATGGSAGAAVMGQRAKQIAHALRSTIQYVDTLKPAVDASIGAGERKRLAERTLDRADIEVIEFERARLNTERLAA